MAVVGVGTGGYSGSGYLRWIAVGVCGQRGIKVGYSGYNEWRCVFTLVSSG